MGDPQLVFPHPMSLQIVLEQASGDAMTYTYHVSRPVTFGQLLGLLERLTPADKPDKPNAFDYEDDEHDKVTVRTDDELTAMMAFYFWECRRVGEPYNLQIFPQYPVRKHKPPRFPALPKINTVIRSQKEVAAVSASKQPIRTKRQDVDVVDILKRTSIQAMDLQLLEVLGHGNGGTVYRALHRKHLLIMAVKLIPVDVNEAVQREIMSELAILHQCDSDFVIRFYGAFFTENRMSICTEYMDGGSLDQYVPIPEQVLGRVAVQVVKGMLYLWEQRDGRIMHRDIKPSNVLVSLTGAVKLCDFGVSVHMVNSFFARSFVGTNAYMAPERIQGEPYSINSEIWSLGISLVEMAIGRFPYPTRESESQPNPSAMLAIELLQMVVNEDPPYLPVPPFSLHFSDFCSQCMRKRPESRISIGELLKHPFMVAMSDNEHEIIAQFVTDRVEQQRASLGNQASNEPGTFRMPSPYTGRHETGPRTPVVAMQGGDLTDDADSAGTITGGMMPDQGHPLAEDHMDL